MAFHYLGVVRRTDGSVATRGTVGPFIESLAPLVNRLSLVAWDPPASAQEDTDRTDFVLDNADNIELCSLGEKGSLRDYPSRRQRVRKIVEEASRHWDVIVFRLVNRRANLVFGANLCPRVVSWTGGHTPSVVRATPMPWRSKVRSVVAGAVAERHVRQIISSSGLAYANSEGLLERYKHLNPQMKVLRTSNRRQEQATLVPDRLTGDPRFLVVGRLTPAKGVFEALEAFAKIRQEVLPRAELHFVGDGDARPALEQRSRELGLGEAAIFHGFVPMGSGLFKHFEESDVLLFLSKEEALPRVVWEALAHSVIVLSARVGALPEVFGDGEEVVFVDRDRESVAAAVQRLRDDSRFRQRLIRTGYERAKEVSAERSAAKLMEDVVSNWPELGGSSSLDDQ